MNEEKIKTLLMSDNREDILIGLSLLGNTDYKILLAKWGKQYPRTGTRYVLKREQKSKSFDPFYYKFENNYYILIDSDYVFCECECNYNIDREVIDH